MPVCMAGRSCSRPGTGVTLSFEQAGQAVATVVTGAEGEFHVSLPPGAYTVRAPGILTVGAVEIVGGSGDQVVVPSGSYVRVALTMDVGIR
jgi:hypothetical protein